MFKRLFGAASIALAGTLLASCSPLGGVTATIDSCSFYRDQETRVRIENTTSDIKSISVTVGYFDEGDVQVDTGYVQTTVAANSTAVQGTLIGPKYAAATCKVVSVIANSQ